MSEVGRSIKRTHAKNHIVRVHSGQDVGAAKYARFSLNVPHTGHNIVDLTAGDAESDGVHDWIRGSSPAIFANHAAKNPNVRVRLWEKSPEVYAKLLKNLQANLSNHGFDQKEDNLWHHPHSEGSSYVLAINGDSSEEDFSHLKRGEWLYVYNDPNNMHGWCLNMAHFLKAAAGDRAVTFMSTMGCNAQGLKRLPLETMTGAGRNTWYARINEAVKLISNHPRLDLVLFPIIGDSAQWAYLLVLPKIWVKDGRAFKLQKEFKNQNLDVDVFSLQTDPVNFEKAVHRLFLTKAEIARLNLE